LEAYTYGGHHGEVEDASNPDESETPGSDSLDLIVLAIARAVVVLLGCVDAATKQVVGDV